MPTVAVFVLIPADSRSSVDDETEQLRAAASIRPMQGRRVAVMTARFGGGNHIHCKAGKRVSCSSSIGTTRLVETCFSTRSVPWQNPDRAP
jgi:hypothetical protein